MTIKFNPIGPVLEAILANMAKPITPISTTFNDTIKINRQEKKDEQRTSTDTSLVLRDTSS